MNGRIEPAGAAPEFTGRHSRDVLDLVSPQYLGRVPAKVGEMLRTRAERGRTDPVATPVPAATVALLRRTDDGPGLRAWMMSRSATMVFAGAYVFPGGKLDRVDAGHQDPLRACAVRELAEETGVRIDPADLHPWAHWITPVIYPKRFDTHMFVAVLPAGQEPDNLTGEADWANWADPCQVLEDEADAEVTPLMPPTRSVLIELCRLGTLERVLAVAADRVIEPITPEPVNDAGQWRFAYPRRDGNLR